MNPELNASALPIVAQYDDPSGFYVIRATDDFMVTTIYARPGSEDIVDQFAEALEPVTLSDDMKWAEWMLTDTVGAVWAEDAGVPVPRDAQRLVLVNGRTFAADWADVVLVNDDAAVDALVGRDVAYTTARGYGMTGQVVSVKDGQAVVLGQDGVRVVRPVNDLGSVPAAQAAPAAQDAEVDSTVVNPHNVRVLAQDGHVFGQWSPEALTADTSAWLEDAVMVDLQPDGSVAVALHANIPTNLDSGGDADAMVRLVLPREVAESIAYLILGHD